MHKSPSREAMISSPHRTMHRSPSKEAMTNSPHRNTPHLPASTSAAPAHGSPRRLRKLQSAHQLSSNYSALNGPSLISQQRQQQQRNTSITQDTLVPPVPALPSPQKHSRARSNSDVPSPYAGPSIRRNPISKKKDDPKDELRSLMRRGPKGEVLGALDELRHLILVDGLEADTDGMSDLRIYIWSILLDAPPVPTDSYLGLIRRGASPAYAKIRNDTHRTLMTNVLFKRRVRENSIIRLLNAIAWRLHDAKIDRLTDSTRITNASTELGSPELQHASPVVKHAQGASTATTDGGSEAGGSEPGIYVQGMNVLCAPFLYAARTEPQAFIAFHRFITRECPGYIRGAMDGVHKGVALVERCLAIADPKLSAYLLSKGVKAQIYAFASVLTMSACTPPLPEVLLLWDFLFAYGSHLNILCICSQLMMMREDLLADFSPGKLLRSFPPLDAKRIIGLTVSMARKIPDDLYEELAHLLAARGASISIVDVRQEPLEEVLASIKESTPNVKIYHKTVNVAKADEVGTWLDETITELGGLHGAANLVGALGAAGEKTIRDLTDEDWDFVMDVSI